ncbi:MAG: TetR/AcrR family transcriptional regulator [Candidatus Thorarchaeota archaeon]
MSRKKSAEDSKKRRLELERKHRREIIVNVAEQAFIEHGYDATMVDQLASEAGYTKATIYNYFDSKDDLFIAVLGRTYEKLFQTLQEMLGQPNAKYELRTLGDAYLLFVDKFPGHTGFFDSGKIGPAIMNIISKEQTKQPLTESESEFRLHQLRVQELMMNVITQTMREAGVEGRVDPFSVIMALSSLNSAIRELVMRGKSDHESGEKTREYLAVLFNIIDQGLKHYDEN